MDIVINLTQEGDDTMKYWYKVIIDGVKQTRLLDQRQLKELMGTHKVMAFCAADETRTGYLSITSATGRNTTC